MNTQLKLAGLVDFQGPEPKSKRLVKMESLGVVPPGMKRRPWRKLSPEEKARQHRYNHDPVVKAKRMAAYRERVAKDPTYLEYFRKRNKVHYQNNKADYRERGRKWVENNRARFNAWLRQWAGNRRLNDPWYVINNRLHSRVWHAFDKGGAKKAHKTEKLVGCTVRELMARLESQFNDGMSWDNRAIWTIDHYVPCVFFDFEKEEHQLLCFDHRNLRPLWEKDNRVKWATPPADALAHLEMIAKARNIDFSLHLPYFTARLAELTLAKITT